MIRTEEDNSLHAKITFPDFTQATVFMQEVATLAVIHNHHPRILNEYTKVELWLSTHDAGNIITEKDRILADAISKLVD